MAQVGKVAFIVGIVIAIAAGLGFNQPWVIWVLAVLGLIVGFLNIEEKETHGFLLASIALMVAASGVMGIPYIGEYATNVISYLIVFLAAAVIVVALKSLFSLTKN